LTQVFPAYDTIADQCCKAVQIVIIHSGFIHNI
jgi:hypothetical protein